MKLTHEQALRLYRAALEADGNSADLAHAAGSQYVTEIMIDNALKSLRRAVSLLEAVRQEIEEATDDD